MFEKMQKCKEDFKKSKVSTKHEMFSKDNYKVDRDVKDEKRKKVLKPYVERSFYND